GGLLYLWARGLALQSAAAEPQQRAALVSEALARNTQAQSCFPPGYVPRALWIQRAALARRARDVAGAERAASQARATPLRSARDSALAALEDPEAVSPGEVVLALSDASRRAPGDFPLWMTLGHLHTLEGRLAEADECYTVAIALRPSSPWPFFHRG